MAHRNELPIKQAAGSPTPARLPEAESSPRAPSLARGQRPHHDRHADLGVSLAAERTLGDLVRSRPLSEKDHPAGEFADGA